MLEYFLYSAIGSSDFLVLFLYLITTNCPHLQLSALSTTVRCPHFQVSALPNVRTVGHQLTENVWSGSQNWQVNSPTVSNLTADYPGRGEGGNSYLR